MSTTLSPPFGRAHQNGEFPGTGTAAPTRNKLLTALPPGELALFLALSEMVTVASKEILFRKGGSIDHVHFPEDCVISLVTQLADGDAIEAMTIGNDGFTDIAALNGVPTMNCEGIGQVTGNARRIKRSDFLGLFASCPELVRLLHRYSQIVFETVSQSAACNRLHVVEQRCAKWLLMSHDRVGRPTFDLTQEFLSQMLGVRRAGVTVAIGILERQGLLAHRRGSITIANRAGLETAACECYGAMQRREAAIVI